MATKKIRLTKMELLSNV